MARTDRLLRKFLRYRYLVTMTGGDSFLGVLTDIDLQHLIIADAAQVDARGGHLRVDGQLWLPRSQVRYMQLLPLTEGAP